MHMKLKAIETYARGRDATCFRCYGALDDISASGYPKGHGAVRGSCCACRMVTYFDVASDNDNQDDAETLATDVMRECGTY